MTTKGDAILLAVFVISMLPLLIFQLIAFCVFLFRVLISTQNLKYSKFFRSIFFSHLFQILIFIIILISDSIYSPIDMGLSVLLCPILSITFCIYLFSRNRVFENQDLNKSLKHGTAQSATP